MAQSTLTDAMAHGKAIVVAETTNSRPVPPPEQEAKEDEVEEVLGRPQDRRQHVYVSRWQNDEWVMHEEILEVEETLLHHVIPCFQAVSTCNLDVSLQFVLNTIVF